MSGALFDFGSPLPSDTLSRRCAEVLTTMAKGRGLAPTLSSTSVQFPLCEVVLRARDTSDDLGRAALEQLCRAYWRPLRAFALRAGHSPEDAEDFTQDFFVRLLSRDALSNVSPDKGRFRNFLLVAFRNFLADQRDKAQTAKRGGGVRPLSLSQTSADGDSDAAPEPADG